MLNNKLYMLITLDIKRVFRDIKYVAFIIILPIFSILFIMNYLQRMLQ